MMPGQNAELLKVLETHKFGTKEEINQLLDDLLSADFNDAKKFRGAVSKHVKTWDTFKSAAQQWVKSYYLSDSRGIKEDDYYQTDDFLDPNGSPAFLELRQAAAAQRVKFNLNKVTDQEVLLHILQYNEEECRAYLAEKVDPNLTKISGWHDTVVHAPVEGKELRDTNDSSDVLNKKYIDEIRQLAAARWVLQQIEKADNQQLEQLEQGSDAAFKKVLIDLGFPADKQDQVNIKGVRETIGEAVQKRLAEFRPAAAMTAYTSHIANLNLDDKGLLAVAKLLPLEGKDFQDALPKLGQHKDHLTADDLVKLRENLGVRYLDVAVAGLTDDKVKPLLQEQNLKAFQLLLQQEFPQHTYIDAVVTQEKMESLKALMAPKLISTLSEAIKATPFKEEELTKLKKLCGSKTLESFKKDLAALVKPELRAAIPYLGLEDMAKLQTVARTQRFAFQINYYAGIIGQPMSRPKLFELFEKLDPAAKNALLERSSNPKGTPILPHILKAQDVSVLKHYLPEAPEDILNALLEENQDSQCLKGVFNPAISRILGNLYPEVKLTDAQVKAINEYLLSAHGRDFSDEKKYTDLIAKLHEIANPQERSKEFYNAFGLSDDGKAVAKDEVRQSVDRQHQYNKPFLEAYVAPTVHHINKKLLSLFLTLEKTAPVPEVTNAQSLQKMISKVFQFSTSPNNFIETVAQGQKDLSRRLIEELTPSVYNDIKSDIRRNAFMNNAAVVIQPLFTQAQQALKQFKRNHDITGEYHEKVKFIPAIQDIHLHNPLFQSKSAQMRGKYVEIAKECDTLIDQLRRDRIILQGYLESTEMSAEKVDPEYKKLKKKVDAFRAELEKEIKRVDEQLEFYGEVQEKISGKDGILDKIDHASSKKFTYQPTGVTTYLIDRTALETAEGKKIKSNPDTADPDHTTVTQAEEAPVSRFVLEDKPKDHEVRCFDTVYKTPASGSTPSGTIEGRFIYDTKKDTVGAQSTGSGKKVSKEEPGKFEIHKFPNDKKVGAKALAEARVRFAMTMATQILASMDKPPTKDKPLRIRGIDKDEMEYLWTAMAILGEKTPNMRFSTDALAVHGSTFKPSEQKGFFGYASSSLYNTVFKEYRETNSIKELVNDVKEHSSKRFDKAPVKKTEQKVETATKFFKDKLNETKEETEARQKAEGITPASKVDTGGPFPS